MSFRQPVFLRGTVLALLVALLTGCATKGRLLDRYAPDQVAVPRMLPEDTSELNPTFYVIGDEQLGRRVVEDFYRTDNWLTWWQLAVPFYQAYLLYNGISGLVNILRHVPDAGMENREMMRDVLYQKFHEENADFVTVAGDICAANGMYVSHWVSFLEYKKWDHPFLDEIPYLPAIGNHEWANDTSYAMPNFEAVFDYPPFYTQEFKYGVLIVMDSNTLVDQWELIDDERQDELFTELYYAEDGSSWLQRTLAEYAGKPHKMIVFHHAPVSFGWHWVDWYKPEFGRDLLTKRRQLLQVIRDGGVSAVFSGHEHLYQRVEVTLNTDSTRVAPVHFITSSGAGAPIRTPPKPGRIHDLTEQYAEEGIFVDSVTVHDQHHYCKVSMDADTLQVVTVSVTRQDGEYATDVVDQVAIPAGQRVAVVNTPVADSEPDESDE